MGLDGREGPRPRYTRPTRLGQLLCAARLELGFTLGQVGEACGVGESGAMTWESGRALPQAARLWRLCAFLQLDVVLVVHACDPRHTAPAELPAGDSNTAGGVQ